MAIYVNIHDLGKKLGQMLRQGETRENASELIAWCMRYRFELVRCGECKWFGSIGCAIEIADESDRPREEDFCSFGERREDDE